jgi:hypothetical protein
MKYGNYKERLYFTENSQNIEMCIGEQEKQKDLFIHVYIPKFVPLSIISHAKW